MPIVDLSEVLLRAGLSGSVTETERAIAQESLNDAESDVIRFLRFDPVQKSHTVYLPNMDFARQSRDYVWEVNDNEAYIRRLAEASTDELQLQHLPVRSITSLFVDYDARSGTRSGSFAASTQWTEGTDFWPNHDLVDSDGNKVCRDGVLKSEGRWPNLPGSVKVTYVAGYTDAELHGTDAKLNARPIASVVLNESIRKMNQIYAWMKKTRGGFATGPFTSENLGDYSYSQDSALLQSYLKSLAGLTAESQDKLGEFVNWGWDLAS